MCGVHKLGCSNVPCMICGAGGRFCRVRLVGGKARDCDTVGFGCTGCVGERLENGSTGRLGSRYGAISSVFGLGLKLEDGLLICLRQRPGTPFGCVEGIGRRGCRHKTRGGNGGAECGGWCCNGWWGSCSEACG